MYPKRNVLSIGGRTGKLQLILAVRQNPDCDPAFFEHYGLQAIITLDTKLCKNIVADGATQANVGADRQLSYTILPGKGKELTVTPTLRILRWMASRSTPCRYIWILLKSQFIDIQQNRELYTY